MNATRAAPTTAASAARRADALNAARARATERRVAAQHREVGMDHGVAERARGRVRVRPARCAGLLLAFALAGCCCFAQDPPPTPLNVPVASDHQRLTVVVETEPGGFRHGFNRFSVRVINLDASAGVLTGLTATMPAHGHTTGAPGVFDRGDGRFEVVGLDIDMAGTWQLDLSLSRTGATEDDRATVWAVID
jgi:hypothetical protein